ncbi:MAG: polymer-forming cytoskeletal protein [Pseudomonadota bacterium]|nr:polymer-forming cytoskeletal protein [Pseudomonadota bacterium]
MFGNRKVGSGHSGAETPELVLPRREGMRPQFSPEPSRPSRDVASPVWGKPKEQDNMANEPRTLMVGREINLRGEIGHCDRLVVHGRAEVTLTDCGSVEIAETGLLGGTAEVQQADVRGRFEGTLQVRGRLVIRSGGRVSGRISYAEIEIEAGGRLDGEITSIETQLVASAAE